MGLNNFVDIHFGIATLVMPSQVLQKVMDEKDSWTSVSEEITQLAEGSTIGERLFRGHLQLVMSERAGQIIEAGIQENMKGHITADMKKECIKTITQKLDDISAGRLLKDKRMVDIKYRGLSLKLSAHSVDEEVNLRIMSHIKGVAVGGWLPPLCFEASVFDQVDQKAAKAAVDKGLLKECILARETANKSLESQALSGDIVKELLNSKRGVLTQLDASFVIELGLSEALCGAGGQEWMEEKVLMSVASAGDLRTIDSSLESLKLLAASDFYRFCTKTTQAALDFVREILVDLRSDQAPNQGIMSSSAFLMKVFGRLPFYCRATKGVGNKAEVLTGKQAIALTYKDPCCVPGFAPGGFFRRSNHWGSVGSRMYAQEPERRRSGHRLEARWGAWERPPSQGPGAWERPRI